MKKRALSLALALTLCLGLVPAAYASGGTAYASTQTILVDGTSVVFQAYALKDANGNDTNYVKLRDVAQVLNGTAAQFEVGWNGAVNLHRRRDEHSLHRRPGLLPRHSPHQHQRSGRRAGGHRPPGRRRWGLYLL